jgi:hypothetical protein
MRVGDYLKEWKNCKKWFQSHTTNTGCSLSLLSQLHSLKNSCCKHDLSLSFARSLFPLPSPTSLSPSLPAWKPEKFFFVFVTFLIEMSEFPLFQKKLIILTIRKIRLSFLIDFSRPTHNQSAFCMPLINGSEHSEKCIQLLEYQNDPNLAVKIFFCIKLFIYSTLVKIEIGLSCIDIYYIYYVLISSPLSMSGVNKSVTFVVE